MNRRNVIVLILLAIIGGVLIGYFLRMPASPDVSPHVHSMEAEEYTCSMHPQIRQNEPGDCPICGMDLVPMATNEAVAREVDQISITEEAKALAQVRTLPIRYGQPRKVVDLAGRVAVNSNRNQSVTARFGGRIESIQVAVEGDKVSKGQVIATLYSPDWITAQQELLEALSAQESRPEWKNAVVRKLRNEGVSPNTIQTIISTREVQEYWQVISPMEGLVLGLPTKPGQYLGKGEQILELGSLQALWVELEGFAQDIEWVQIGDTIHFSVEGTHASSYVTVVQEKEDLLDPITRTATIRGVVEPSQNALQPGMLVSATVEGRGAEVSLLIPKSAVLWTGNRSLVWVEELGYDEPTYRIKDIELGRSLDEFFELVSGLAEGDRVVAEGAFAVDATAQLAGRRSMMNPDIGEPDQQDLLYPGSASLDQWMEVFLANYFMLKNALVLEDEVSLQSALKSLQRAVNRNVVNLPVSSAKAWQEYQDALKQNLAVGSSVEGVRMQLNALSITLMRVLTAFELSTPQTLYYQYCPMAHSNEGGYWISKKEEIRNPYFGDKMLTCGEVSEVINPITL